MVTMGVGNEYGKNPLEHEIKKAELSFWPVQNPGDTRLFMIKIRNMRAPFMACIKNDYIIRVNSKLFG